MKKAEQFKTAAIDAGWVAEVTIYDDRLIEATAKRADESIWIQWDDGKVLTSPIYRIAGHERRLYNVAGAKRQLVKKPNYKAIHRKTRRPGGGRPSKATIQAAQELKELVGRRESVDPPAAVGTSAQMRINGVELIGSLPFSIDDDDQTILRLCYNHTLVWQNSLTGNFEECHVVRGSNFDKVIYHISYSSTGRRVLNFVTLSGFRSVAIDQLLQVK